MKKIVLYIVSVFVFAGCNDDFMDRYPQTSIAPEEFFKTEEDLALYINGLISLPGMGQYQADQSSDNMATTGAIEIKNIMTGSPSSQTITGGWNWTRLRNINYFLANIENTEASPEAINHFAGLARFYRAQFYMDMVKRYSDVPWYDELLSPTDEQLYKARDPRAFVMEKVMEDLEFASTHVREDVPTGSPGKWAVMTYYARTALYEGTFRKYHDELGLQQSAETFLAQARDISQEIISSGKFSIYITGQPQSDYHSLFSSQNLIGNPEVILANPYDINKDRNSDINYTVFGSYEQSPSRDLVQTYLMRDGSRFTDKPGYETLQYVEEFQDRDPRMAQTLVYPGWVRVPDPAPFVPLMNRNFSGYFQRKGYNNTIDNIAIGSLDFPVYRYAEVVLTYAEAKGELNELSQSDLDISLNLLRARAGMPPMDLNQANAAPDPILMTNYPLVTGPNSGAILEIRRERRVEFAMEGYRHDDLMRWAAGKLLERIPEGMYFPGLGKYDLTGDGHEDIILINKDSNIPTDPEKERNQLGTLLVYYRAGTINDNVTVFLKNGTNGGTLVTETTTRQFIAPKYYYRPIPIQQVTLNNNLQQIFGWE